MKSTYSITGLALLAMVAAAPAANIAGTGTAIMGVNTAIDATLGTPYTHQSGGGPAGPAVSAARLNDGVLGAPGVAALAVDSWNGNPAATGTFAYVGITGFTIPAGEHITSLSLEINTFFDGGWFGPNGVSPAAGTALTGANLIVPTIQVSSDGGTTWSTVASSVNDYLAVLTGHTIGGGANPNPTLATVTFQLDSGQTGVDGIRIIGSEGGGPAGADLGGFIAASELTVDTTVIPEPSSLMLLGAMGALFAFRRRR